MITKIQDVEVQEKKAPAAFEVLKVATGIDGFDLIALGGLPAGRTTLLTGTSGTGKTSLALEFLWHGAAELGEPGVFVTFEERALDIEQNAMGFGWDLAALAAKKQIMIVDASPTPYTGSIVGQYDFGALLARIEYAIGKVKAKRVVLDSISALFPRFGNASTVRVELLRIMQELKALGTTTIVTGERPDEYGPAGRHGVEDFVSDGVVILRNISRDQKRHRTIEILKFRGTPHQQGEYPYTISESGIHVMPLNAVKLTHAVSNTRITSGVKELDDMTGGGFMTHAMVLVSGATGTGKTLASTLFINAACEAGTRALILGYEESESQIVKNAASFGLDLAKHQARGLLKIVCNYPEAMGLEDRLYAIKKELDTFKPEVMSIDSLSTLERSSNPKTFAEFVIGLTNELKERGITAVLTNSTNSLSGEGSVTVTRMSSIADSVVLLRYAEVRGELLRGLAVLKMRGSWHDKSIRECTIDSAGMHLGEPLRNVEGILLGTPRMTVRDRRRGRGSSTQEGIHEATHEATVELAEEEARNADR